MNKNTTASRTTEQRLEMLEASVLSLTQSIQSLTQALHEQTRAIDGLASAIDLEAQVRAQELEPQDREEPATFLSQR